MAQRKPKLQWAEILAKLHLEGMTLTELARINDISVGCFTRVKGQTHYAAQQIIADFIGEKPEDLWPDRYPKGKPRILDRTKYPLVASGKKPLGADEKDAA